MNITFIDHLKEYDNSPQYIELFAKILKGNFKNCDNTVGKKLKRFQAILPN